MPTDAGRVVATGSALLAATVEALSTRAPAVVAAAAEALGDVVLGLHFGDDSHATLRRSRSRLHARDGTDDDSTAEVYFDARALSLLFDLARRPVDEVLVGSLDVRGTRADVLAVWRTMRLLSQRASGLRAVQELWRSYREHVGYPWGEPPSDRVPRQPVSPSVGLPKDSGWTALDYLDRRSPASSTVADLGASTVNGSHRQLWDGHRSTGWWETDRVWDADLLDVMARCRDRVAAEMNRLVPDRQPKLDLYDLMRSYPTRQGKGLRPSLTIASCGAFGGRPDDAVRVAAALELFHNGFLVHDDIADGSTHRRGKPTLHDRHGLGLAVNAGDGLNLLAVDAVLANLDTLGLARTLGLIHEVLHMCRETVEGQAIELGWIRREYVPRGDRAYFHMSTKKTGWYTCISPCRLGAICAGVVDPGQLDALNEAFRWIGIAFQIQDDVLNLVGEEALYGKEPLGDLLEGKRTVMLIHLMRTATGHARDDLYHLAVMPREEKSQSDAEALLAAMDRHGSLDYALDLADRLARRGSRRFELDLASVPENESKAILRQIANYVTTRPL